MIVIEVVGGLLITAAVVVMAYAGVVGFLGILGAVRFVRCDRCGHIGATSLRVPMRSCVHCRHGRLLHPIDAWHHSHIALQPLLEHDDTSGRVLPFPRSETGAAATRAALRGRTRTATRAPSWR